MANKPNFLEFIEGRNRSNGAPAPVAPPQFSGTQVQAPTVGPTLANDPRAVPMLGGFEVQGEGAGRFPLGVPDDQLIEQPVPQPSLTPGNVNLVPSTLDTNTGTLSGTGFSPTKAPDIQSSASPFGGGSQFRTESTGSGLPDHLSRSAEATRGLIPMGLPGALPFEIPADLAATATPSGGATAGTPSVFNNTNAPLPSGGVGQIDAPTPFAQPPSQNPLLAPQIEQDFAPQTPDVIAGTSFGAAPQQPQAPSNDFGLTGFTPQFQGQTPSQFMRGEDAAEAVTTQGLDAQGRLRQFDSPEAQQANITQGQADFDQASADREARIDQNFGESRGPDSRDRDGGMSFAEARKQVPKRQGETASAYNDRVKAFAAQSTGGSPLTVEQQMAERKQNFAEGKFTSDVMSFPVQRRVIAMFASASISRTGSRFGSQPKEYGA